MLNNVAEKLATSSHVYRHTNERTHRHTFHHLTGASF